MGKNNLHFLLIMLLLRVGPSFAHSISCKPVESGDKVKLFTDRAIYIAGEQVHFSATLFYGNNPGNPWHSSILYCELITPDGSKMAGNKYLVSDSSSGGCLDIPKGLLTGTYYLRAYTKQMRNYGPGSYGYVRIRIINPGRPEVLATENNHEIPVRELIPAVTELNDMLIVSVDKTVYSPRDTISLSLQSKNSTVTGIESLCLSVIPEGTASSSLLLQTVKEQPHDKTDYYPETHGLSISGKLTEANSPIPVKDKRINLSIIGEGRDFMSFRTDSLGRFFFSLPGYYGSRDLFLCAEKTPGKDVKIWVDNDFCTLPYLLPAPEFSLNEQERLAAYNMALNLQIGSHFRIEPTVDSLFNKKEEKAFYGKPTNIIYIDKYISLPTLEEYFNELPCQVKVRKRNGESCFVVSSSREISFNDPLVMVDWVAVDEPAKILAVSPQNVSRIEIVNEDYVKGGQTYGGIVSIISKKGDFAGIDLPSAGIFVKYGFLTQNQCQEEDYDNIPVHPDVRNTLFWRPSLGIQNGKSEKFVVAAPETPGRYCVVLEGVTKSGEILTMTRTFEVKN